MTSSIKELAGPVAGITGEEAAWATIAVCRHVPDEAVSDVLAMLGLVGEHAVRHFDMTVRRAVPDGFRRGRTGRKK